MPSLIWRKTWLSSKFAHHFLTWYKINTATTATRITETTATRITTTARISISEKENASK